MKKSETLQAILTIMIAVLWVALTILCIGAFGALVAAAIKYLGS